MKKNGVGQRQMPKKYVARIFLDMCDISEGVMEKIKEELSLSSISQKRLGKEMYNLLCVRITYQGRFIRPDNNRIGRAFGFRPKNDGRFGPIKQLMVDRILWN